MPILSPDWTTKTGFQPFMQDMPVGINSWKSYLPSEDSLLDETSGKSISEFYTEAMSFRTWNGSAMSAIRVIGTETGFLGARMDALGLLAENLSESFQILDIARTVGGSLLGSLGEVIENLSDTIMDALGSIPFAGWVIKIAQVVARFIQAIIDRGPEEYPRIPCLPWQRYAKQADEDYALFLFNNLQTRDWTTIFLPPAAGVQGFDNFKLDQPNAPGEYNGSRLVPRGAETGGALGFLPTIPYAVTDWQAPFGHAETEINGFRSVGQFYPSANQLALQVWSQINKNSPDAFKINGNAISIFWRSYFESASKAATGAGFQGADPENCFTSALAYGPRNDLIADATMPIAVIPKGGDRYEVRAYSSVQGLQEYDNERGRLVNGLFNEWIIGKIESEPQGWGEMIYYHEGDDFSAYQYPSSNHIKKPHFRVSLYYWLEFVMAVWTYNVERWAASPVGAYVGYDYAAAGIGTIQPLLNETRRRVVEDPVWLQAVEPDMIFPADPALANEVLVRQLGLLQMDPATAEMYARQAADTIPESESESETPPGLPGLTEADFLPPSAGKRRSGGGAALGILAAAGLGYLAMKGK